MGPKALNPAQLFNHKLPGLGGLSGGNGDSASGVTVIRPRRGWQPVGLINLWRHRELVYFLALRDIKVRYKQTVLGAIWAVLQPLVMMVVLSLLFGRLMNVDQSTGGVPYPIFVYAGLLPWTFFAASVTASTNSLVSNANMLRKVYFPRLAVPVASVGAPLLDYAVSFAVLLGLMAWYGVPLSTQVLLLPLLVGVTIVAAAGVGVLLSGLTVRYRDFRYVVPFMIQVWFFITPVIWPSTLVPERYRWLTMLNPMGGTIEAFRASILGHPIDTTALAVSALVAGLFLVAGLVYFGRAERSFADVV